MTLDLIEKHLKHQYLAQNAPTTRTLIFNISKLPKFNIFEKISSNCLAFYVEIVYNSSCFVYLVYFVYC